MTALDVSFWSIINMNLLTFKFQLGWANSSFSRTESAQQQNKMASYDLITRMGQYLDRHLVFPLLEFLSVKQVARAHLSLIR